MKTSEALIKIAVGVLTGIATVAALSSLKSFSKNEEIVEDEIPDEIFDGPLSDQARKRIQKNRLGHEKCRRFREKTERNVRDLQDSLSKVASIITSLSTAVTNIARVFYEEPYERISPVTVIY